MLSELLPLVDDLDRAVAQLPTELATHPWAQGVAMGHRRLLRPAQVVVVGPPTQAAFAPAMPRHYDPPEFFLPLTNF